MNWSVVFRAVLRYSIVYAGMVVVGTALILRSEIALLGIVGLGFFVLMIAGKGVGAVQTSTVGTTAESAMFRSGTVAAKPAKAIAGDEKLALFGLGLILLGFTALILVGELLLG